MGALRVFATEHRIVIAFLLGCFHWLLGVSVAILVCSAIGLCFGALIALFRLFGDKWNWVVLLKYLAGATLCNSMIWLIGYVSYSIGELTHYWGSPVFFIGVLFPGLVALNLIPTFVSIAFRQTGGSPFR